DLTPGLSLRSLDAQRDLLLVGVDAEDVDIHLFADLQHLGWVLHPAPGKLREMDQAIRPSDIDERTEVADARHAATTSLAFVKLLDQALLHNVPLLLYRLPLGEDQPIPMPVDLNNLQ